VILEDAANAVLITLAFLVVCIGVVEEAKVLDFLGKLNGSLVGEEMSNLIWLIHSIQVSRIDFIC